MADEAFALSPISARPTPPSEADYEAIRAAFVETSRGRWFLGEYARRNRNADTTMVLDAVARIEQSIATRSQPSADIADVIDAIKAFVVDARADANDSPATIERSAELASACKSARVIREIAWSLRECGTDIRICDILDAQLRGIDALTELAGSSRQADAVADAFDRLLMRIDSLNGAADPRTVVDTAPVELTDDAQHAPHAPVPQFDTPVIPPAAAARETDMVDGASADIAYPEDDEVLDLVAHEMAAPQTDLLEREEIVIAGNPAIAPSEAAPPPTAAPAALPEPAVTTSAPPLQPESMPLDSLQPSLEPSLGAALIANGVVRTPSSPRVDPLAAIRRLSQTEKIALFS